MKNFRKKVITTYYWKDREIAFTPEGSCFDSIAWIDESSGRLDFLIYNDFRSDQAGAETFASDCVGFAEAICDIPCKTTYIGYGYISCISVVPSNGICSYNIKN